MSFQWPYALIALIVVPVLVYLAIKRERSRDADAARFGNPALLPNLVTGSPGWRRKLPLVVLLAALAAMVVGVARPHANVSVRREEATVVLAIDISRSMKAKDIPPSRLDAARKAAAAFIQQVPTKFRIAVVTFGTHAVVGVPPTEDRTLIDAELQTLRPGEGTALGDAVLLSTRLGERQRTSDGHVPPTAVLLISDGAIDGGRVSVRTAIQRAKTLHIPVYGILIGTPGGVVQETLPGGLRTILRVPPNPGTMRLVTQGTGGELFTATNDAGLKDVYEKLGSRLGHKVQSREISDLFAAGSLGLLLVGGGLSAFWFRRVLP